MSTTDLAELEERIYSDLSVLAKSGRDLISQELIDTTRAYVAGSVLKTSALNARVQKMIKRGWLSVGSVRGARMTRGDITIIIDEGGRVFERGNSGATNEKV